VDALAQLSRKRLHFPFVEVAQVQKAFSNRVVFDSGNHREQDCRGFCRQASVKRVVRTEDRNFLPLDEVAEFELGISRFYPEGLCFRRTSHSATIVVGENDNRNAFEVGPKHTLAGDVEVVAIDQSEDFFHDSSQGVDGVFHDAENVKVLTKRNADRFVERVRRFEPYAVRSAPQAFHRVLPVDGHDDHTAVLRMCGPVRNQEITVQDSRVSHRVTIDPHQECSCSVVDQEVGQIERSFQIIFGRAWEARRYTSIKIRQYQQPIYRPFDHAQRHASPQFR
jgi:hypothetical protein